MLILFPISTVKVFQICRLGNGGERWYTAVRIGWRGVCGDGVWVQGEGSQDMGSGEGVGVVP